MVLRWAKILAALSVGVWGLLGTFGNLSDLPGVYAEVSQVTTMIDVPEGVGPPVRSDNAVIVGIGTAAIVLGKIAALIGGVFGGLGMLRTVNGTAEAFHASKTLAVAGCGLSFVLMYVTFTVIGESLYFMFYTPAYVGAAELAFRLSASVALVALFIAQREPA